MAFPLLVIPFVLPAVKTGLTYVAIGLCLGVGYGLAGKAFGKVETYFNGRKLTPQEAVELGLLSIYASSVVHLTRPLSEGQAADVVTARRAYLVDALSYSEYDEAIQNIESKDCFYGSVGLLPRLKDVLERLRKDDTTLWPNASECRVLLSDLRNLARKDLDMPGMVQVLKKHISTSGHHSLDLLLAELAWLKA
jgi:enoyl-CoA hydratase/carnithine racemase